MTRYRKSFIVSIMYFIPALLLAIVLIGGFYVFLIGSELFVDTTFWLMCAIALAALLIVVYMIYQTSIAIDVTEESIVIRRFLKTRYQGELDETELRVHFSRSSNLLRPSQILLFVKNPSMDFETRVIASGLGESRTQRFSDKTFGVSEVDKAHVIPTKKPSRRTY